MATSLPGIGSSPCGAGLGVAAQPLADLDLAQTLEHLRRQRPRHCVLACGLGEKVLAVVTAVRLHGGRVLVVEQDVAAQTRVRRLVIHAGLDESCRVYAWETEMWSTLDWRERMARWSGSAPVGHVLLGGDFGLVMLMQMQSALPPLAPDALVTRLASRAVEPPLRPRLFKAPWS